MTMTNLGAAFQNATNGPRSLDAESFIDALKNDIVAELESRLLRPIVQVPPAHVAVAAPNVAVTPTIQVDVPETAPAEITVALPGVDDLCACLDRIDTHLTELATLLRTPVTRTFYRDSQGMIERTTETRHP